MTEVKPNEKKNLSDYKLSSREEKVRRAVDVTQFRRS